MKVWHLFLGLVAGLGIPIQAAINTRLGAMFGGQPLMAAFVSFTVGALLLCLVSLLFVDWQAVQSGLSDMQISDWWKWLGGALGAFFVFASIFLAPKIGVTNTVFLFILGQMVMGMDESIPNAFMIASQDEYKFNDYIQQLAIGFEH